MGSTASRYLTSVNMGATAIQVSNSKLGKLLDENKLDVPEISRLDGCKFEPTLLFTWRRYIPPQNVITVLFSRSEIKYYAVDLQLPSIKRVSRN